VRHLDRPADVILDVRDAGKTNRERLGRFPHIKPDKARDLAQAKTSRKAEGVELGESRRARRRSRPLAQLKLG
jgi:hypothetical protein